MSNTKQRDQHVQHVLRKQQNAEIDNLIMFNLEYYKSEGKEAIDQRIQELDREWDVERTLQMNAAAFALTGTLLAAVADKRWMLVSFLVTAFLAQHAIRGWCPPVEILRRMGVRTRLEIDREKYALKALRGDFKAVHDSAEAWAAVNY